VKNEVEKVIAGENPAAVARAAHNDCIANCFNRALQPDCLNRDLGRIQEHTVYLRGSRYVRRGGRLCATPCAFFDLLEKEPEASVRAVLDTGFRLYPPIPGWQRPYGALPHESYAGFGRLSLDMIRIVDRKSYLSALDRASIEMDIHPFTNFIVHRVQWRLEQHDVTFPAPNESLVFGRDLVLSTARWRSGRAVLITGKPWKSTSGTR